jgi:membrane-bound serine protease (ClpP class)
VIPDASALAATLVIAADTGDTGFTGWLTQPSVAFLLLVIGTASLLVEATNPGIIGTGVFGVACVLAGLWSLSRQDVSTAGLLLVVLALGLFAVEVLASGTMVAAVAGTIALVIGGLVLVQGGEGVPAVVVLPVAALSGAAALLGGRFALRARRMPSRYTGGDQLVGRVVTVAATADERPRAFTEGAWWTLRPATGTPLPPGATAIVVDVDGLTLVVEPMPPSGGDDPLPGAP